MTLIYPPQEICREVDRRREDMKQVSICIKYTLRSNYVFAVQILETTPDLILFVIVGPDVGFPRVPQSRRGGVERARPT